MEHNQEILIKTIDHLAQQLAQANVDLALLKSHNDLLREENEKLKTQK